MGTTLGRRFSFRVLTVFFFLRFLQTRLLRRSRIAVENQRPEHRPRARLLFVRRTLLSGNRIHAIRRSQSVSPGTRRPDRGAGAAVRENAEVRCVTHRGKCKNHVKWH